MRKILFFIAVHFALVQSMTGQTKITGSINDAQGKPLSNVNILLVSLPDSSLMKGMITDSAGKYFFEKIPLGQYLLVCSSLGYAKTYSPPFDLTGNKDEIEIGPIILSQESRQLSEVKVKTKKPMIEQKIDRTIINVRNSITNTGSTVLDILERSPGVVVNRQTNSIMMNGKDGVVVMINGRNTNMPMDAVLQLLAAMSSSNIERIELITTPPTNYDAEGNAGFINIVLTENRQFGLNGNYSASFGWGKGPYTDANSRVNYRKNKLNLFADYSFVRRDWEQPFFNYRKLIEQGNEIENLTITNRQPVQRNHSARMGIDLQLSKKTLLGLLISGYDNRWSMISHNDVTISKNYLPDTLLKVVNNEVNNWKNFSTNLNLVHNYNGDEKLSFDIDYLFYRDDNPNDYINTYYNGNGSFLFEEKARSSKLTPIHMGTAKADYSKKISPKLSMEAGIKTGIYRFNNDVVVEQLINNNWTKDNKLTAAYKLREEIAAAYTSFTFSPGEKTTIKTGVRYEWTSSNLGSGTVKNIVDKTYGDIFPSFFISIKPDDRQTFNLSYNRRITRPTFNEMAPFVIFIDPNTFFSGNPALQPSYTNVFSAGYNLKRLVFSVSYNVINSPITRFQSKVDTSTNKQTFASENLEKGRIIAANFSLPFKITGWWNIQNNLSLTWQEVSLIYQQSLLTLSQKNIQATSINNFSLPKNFSIELLGRYQSPALSGSWVLKAFGTVNVGLAKKTGKGNFTLNFSDIFNTNKWKNYNNSRGQDVVTRFEGQFFPRSVILTYSRSFGNKNVQNSRTRHTAIDDEKRVD